MEQVLTQVYMVFYLVLAMASVVVGVFVFIRDKKRPSNIFFLALTVFIGLWFASVSAGVGDFTLISPNSLNEVLPYLFMGAAPLLFLFFAFTFTQKKIYISNTVLALTFLPYTLIALVLYFFPSYIVVTSESDRVAGPFCWIFVVYIIGYVMIGFFLLLKRYYASAGVFKTILRSTVWIVGGGFSGVFVATVVYILTGNELFRLIGYFLICVMLIGVGFKIMQYHRWRIKPFIAELFVSLVVLIFIAQMFFITSGSDIMINIVALILFVVSGYFLVKSINREAQAQDEIEKLVKDLTDVNDELQILDKRKSEFVKISAHHLKNPLTAIKGYASMIIEGSFGKDMNQDAMKAIQKIFDASERLVNIISDFMDISNIESGKMEYVFENTDIKKLTEGVLEEMSVTIEKSGLDVSFNTDEIEGYEIKADPGKLRQVISNLTDNAIKYTPQGKVHLFLKKEPKSKKLHFTITDTGVGMSQETIKGLFEKFSRAHDANKVNTGGSGLGLYVAKEIMKKHNSRIWVESPGEGKGSTFHLEFTATE